MNSPEHRWKPGTIWQVARQVHDGEYTPAKITGSQAGWSVEPLGAWLSQKGGWGVAWVLRSMMILTSSRDRNDSLAQVYYNLLLYFAPKSELLLIGPASA